MNATDLLDYLRDHDVVLAVHGDRLDYHGPSDVLDDATLDKVRRLKSDLLALLQAVTSAPSPPDADLDDWEPFVNEFGLPGIRRSDMQWPDTSRGMDFA